jgi:hypothetical protein
MLVILGASCQTADDVAGARAPEDGGIWIDAAASANARSRLFECADPTPVEGSIFLVRCGNGVVHAEPCQHEVPCGAGVIQEVIPELTAAAPGMCRTDLNCSPGLMCIQSGRRIPEPNCTKPGSVYGLFCQTPRDECGSSNDCTGGSCLFDGERHVCEVIPYCAY